MTVPAKKPKPKPKNSTGATAIVPNSSTATNDQPTTPTNWTDPHFGYKKTSTGYTYSNPYGLGQHLGPVNIQGVWDILGVDPGPTQFFAQSGMAKPQAPKSITADQAMYLFTQASPNQLATIQQRMYLAGFYGNKNFIPTPGVLRAEDVAAFRKAMIGLASNPSQGPLGDYLDATAQAGADSGAVRQHTPLVVSLTNSQDIANMANSVAYQLHGTYLNPDQLKTFTDTFHQMESAYQTQHYAATGYDPASGQQDAGYDPSSLVGSAPTSLEKPQSLELALQQKIREANPEQFAANTFTDKLNLMLNSIKGSGRTSALGNV